MSTREDAGAPARTVADDDQAQALKLWVVLARAYQSVARHSSADIARHSLSTGEFAVLEALYHRGPLLLGELQEKILVSSGGITYLVDRLEARELVERQECPGDRRARYAALTERGRDLIRRIFPDHAEAIAHAVAELSPEERAAATQLLRRLGRSAAVASPKHVEG